MLVAAPTPSHPEALAIAPLLGWLMLAAAVWVFLGVFNYRRQLARLLFRPDDPRPVAALRIVFATLLLLSVNGMTELGLYLWTDEGIFTTDVARHLFGREQYAGFGDGIGTGEPYGFFDLSAVWQFLQGPKFSLLFFWDSPAAYWCHLIGFNVACVGFLLGYRTRLFGLCTLVLFHSLYLRNYLFWEGEDIYRTFLLYLCFARCGYAYSLDNWLRCRRARAAGQAIEVLRPIPAWPRVLMIAQLGVAYTANGCAKTGPVWSSGNAIYYLLSVDHYSRFELHPWLAELAPVLRVLSWMVRYWETLFFLAVIGWVLNKGLRGHLGDISETTARRGRWLWGIVSVHALAIAWIAYPVHMHPDAGPAEVRAAQLQLACVWVGVTAVVLWLARRLRQGGSVAGGRITAVKLQRWLLSRRIWLGFGCVFHIGLFCLCNLGWFGLAHLAVYLVFFEGEEIERAAVSLLRLVGRGAKVRAWKQRPVPVVSEVRTVWLVGGVGTVALVGAMVCLYLQNPQLAASRGLTQVGWPATPMLLLAAIVWVAGRAPSPATGGLYSRRGRVLIGVFLLYHTTGVLVFNLPAKQCLSTWRGEARAPFRFWIRTSQTDQYWRMMAPNAPVLKFDLRVRVRDRDGVTHDLHTDVYNDQRWPPNRFAYTRSLKINRRLAGEALGPEDWYQPWHARYVCRQWALSHGGERAEKVTMSRLVARIPSPAWVRKNGGYDPLSHMRRQGKEVSLVTADCRRDPRTQVPNFLRRRHGLPEVEPAEVGLWPKHKAKSWKQARARGETPGDIPWALMLAGIVAIWIWRLPRTTR